jgi:SLIDE
MTCWLLIFKKSLQKKSRSTISSSRRSGSNSQARIFSMPLISDCSADVLLPEYPRIEQRIVEGEAKRNKRSNLESLLLKKIASVKYPMQELELNYPTTKGKVYSEEEDRYLLCRLNYYGMTADDVYERIKKDITEFPVFRFDWFFKSRSPQELQRRCNTLLGMIEKEAEVKQQEEIKAKGGPRGKVSFDRNPVVNFGLIVL